jgi:hypothetical protein
VTYGLVALMATVALASLEPWPLTSFRLFSETRTGTRTVRYLEAVRVDGAHVPVRFDQDRRLTRSTQRQLPHLAGRPEAVQVAKSRAWLAAAHIDAATVTHVLVVEVRRTLQPHGGPPVDRGRHVVLEVEIR